MKTKTIRYELSNSSLNYRLNDKKIFLYHNGLGINKTPLDTNIDLIIDAEGNINNSLDIKIEKVDVDKYKIKYPNGLEETLNVLYYFLDDNNVRQYVNKEDVTINPDGSMEYEGKVVKAYYKNDNGFILSGDYDDFINSDDISFKNEDLENLEIEVLNINSTIKDLEYQNSEYGKVFDNDYQLYTTYQNSIENLSYDVLNLQAQLNNEILSNSNSLYNYKSQYYNKTKKTLGTAYGALNTNAQSASVSMYLYDDSNGRNYEIYNQMGFFTDGDYPNPNPTSDKAAYKGLNPAQKASKYYEQEFTKQVEALNQQLQLLSNNIEQTSWNYQKQINSKNESIKDNQALLLSKKQSLEQRYNQIRDTYYTLCITRNNNLISYYNKLKTLKEYELNKYKRQIPVIFLVDSSKTIIYGFNEYNNLSVIFDKNGNQLVFDFKDDKITSITSNDNKTIELKYNSDGYLVNIINDIGKTIKINYENDKVISIIDFEDNFTNISYSNDKLYEIIDNTSVGYRLYYNDGVLSRVDKFNSLDHHKELNNYSYANNQITLIDKEKYILDGNDYIYSNHQFIFDNDNSLLTEIEYKNNEIYNITGYEYDSEHCNFTFNTSKDDNLVFSLSDQTFTGIEANSVVLPETIKTDYTLYAILNATSLSDINEYRTTAYCSHTYNTSNIKYEIRVSLAYSDETLTFGASLNPSIAGNQLLSFPVTLKEDENGKAIRPNSITVYVDYSNNNGNCEIVNLFILECSYKYIEYDRGKLPKEVWYNDIKYPIIENGVKAGYCIKTNHQAYEYNINELKEKEISYTNYEKYDLNNNLVLNDEKIISKKYYYDNNSNVIKVIDSDLNVAIYEYDDKGNNIRTISYNEKNPSNKIINESKYEDNGFMSSSTNELGYETKYKDTTNELYIESPNGFIISESDDSIKSDLISHSCQIENGILKTEAAGSMKYSYTYDEWKRESSLLINDNLYMSFEYYEYLGEKYYISKLNDNTGYMKVCDLYDKLLCIKKIYNETQEVVINYNYDSNDKLISLTNKDDEAIETYYYIDNVLSKIETNDYIKKYSNDIYGNNTSTSYDNDIYDYEYNDDNNIISLGHNEYEESIYYDSLKRIKELNSIIISNSYEYLNINTRTTNLINIHKQVFNNKVIYNKLYYDKNGNIIKSNINHNENVYHYDGLNRVIRCDMKELNHSYTYEYDENNNIISKGIHDLSYENNLENSEYVDYSYDKDNKLISYDNNQITYDESLRPINYKNNTLVWDNNKLLQYGNNQYEYDHNRLRIKKITSSSEIDYIRDGNKLLKEIITSGNSINGQIDNGSNISNFISTITYNYGINGIIGFTLNSNNQTKDYYYIKNIFNDVVEIIDEEYNTYAKYQYDIFGKCTIIENLDNIANINPIRYRSYYYDNETNLYYLNTRYYDPETMRFISLDSIEYLDYNTLGGLNLWVYCNNNPIMNVDPDGNWKLPVWVRGVIGILGGPIGLAFIGANQAYESSRLLNKSGVETFFWTLSGIFVGNAGVVAFNWNTVVEQTKFNIDTIGDSNFIFQGSKHYTLWTSFIYSTYMKKEYYNDNASRSVAGIDLEMIFHYILYAFNIEKGRDGAKIQRFDPSPLGIKKDFDAFVFEFISILINPIFYFFR